MDIFKTFFEIGGALGISLTLFGVVPSIMVIKIFTKKR